MEYEEFKQHIRDNIKQYLTAEFADCEMQIVKRKKDNQVETDDLTYKGFGNEILNPSISLNGLYEQYKSGENMTDIMWRLAWTIIDAECRIKGYSMNFSDYENLKDQIFAAVLNAERNSELLQDVPHEIREDLAIVYRLEVTLPKDKPGSFLIHNSHLEKWGIDAETLKETAWKNMHEHFKPVVLFLGDSDSGEAVLGRKGGNYGAAYIFDEQTMDKVAQKFGTDIVVIPHTMHTVMLAKKREDMDYDRTKQIALNAKASGVKPEKFLSDEIYLYEKDTHIFSKIDTDSQTQGMDMTM